MRHVLKLFPLTLILVASAAGAHQDATALLPGLEACDKLMASGGRAPTCEPDGSPNPAVAECVFTMMYISGITGAEVERGTVCLNVDGPESSWPPPSVMEAMRTVKRYIVENPEQSHNVSGKWDQGAVRVVQDALRKAHPCRR